MKYNNILEAIKFRRVENKCQNGIEAITTLIFFMGTYAFVNFLEFDKITCLGFIQGVMFFTIYLFIGYYILTKINEAITNKLFPN